MKKEFIGQALFSQIPVKCTLPISRFNESFVFFVKEELLREVTLEVTVCDYDKIG